MRCVFVIVLSLLLLIGCEETPSFAGKWKAQDLRLKTTGAEVILEIKKDGTFSTSSKITEDVKPEIVTGAWENTDNKKAKLMFNLGGQPRPLDIEMLDTDTLEFLDPNEREKLRFKRQK